jgi:hypothetical protein
MRLTNANVYARRCWFGSALWGLLGAYGELVETCGAPFQAGWGISTNSSPVECQASTINERGNIYGTFFT